MEGPFGVPPSFFPPVNSEFKEKGAARWQRTFAWDSGPLEPVRPSVPECRGAGRNVRATE